MLFNFVTVYRSRSNSTFADPLYHQISPMLKMDKILSYGDNNTVYIPYNLNFLLKTERNLFVVGKVNESAHKLNSL